MQGTIVFKPIQANFNFDCCEDESKINPYCEFKLGWHTTKTCTAKEEGSCAEWKECISLKKNKEHFATLKIKDRSKDRFRFDRVIGKARINLEPVTNKGNVLGWYNIKQGDKIIGQILLEVEFVPKKEP